jgi:hypothetical protein
MVYIRNVRKSRSQTDSFQLAGQLRCFFRSCSATFSLPTSVRLSVSKRFLTRCYFLLFAATVSYARVRLILYAMFSHMCTFSPSESPLSHSQAVSKVSVKIGNGSAFTVTPSLILQLYSRIEQLSQSNFSLSQLLSASLSYFQPLPAIFSLSQLFSASPS